MVRDFTPVMPLLGQSRRVPVSPTTRRQRSPLKHSSAWSVVPLVHLALADLDCLIKAACPSEHAAHRLVLQYGDGVLLIFCVHIIISSDRRSNVCRTKDSLLEIPRSKPSLIMTKLINASPSCAIPRWPSRSSLSLSPTVSALRSRERSRNE